MSEQNKFFSLNIMSYAYKNFHVMENPFVNVSKILLDAKQQINETLNDNDHGTTLITLRSSLDRMINQVNFLSGQSIHNPSNYMIFEPVTTFMGKDLGKKEPIQMSDLSPQELVRKQFVAKVDQLQAQLQAGTANNEAVLDAYSNDQNVVRGVAKRAGLEDYRTAAINDEYLNQIKEGLKAQQDNDKAKDIAEINLKQAQADFNEGTDKRGVGGDTIVT